MKILFNLKNNPLIKNNLRFVLPPSSSFFLFPFSLFLSLSLILNSKFYFSFEVKIHYSICTRSSYNSFYFTKFLSFFFLARLRKLLFAARNIVTRRTLRGLKLFFNLVRRGRGLIAVEWLEGVTNARQTLKANDFQRRVMNFNEIHNYAAAHAFHFAKRIKDKGGGEAINHSNPLSFFHHILSSCSKTLPTFHFFESVYIYIYIFFPNRGKLPRDVYSSGSRVTFTGWNIRDLNWGIWTR